MAKRAVVVPALAAACSLAHGAVEPSYPTKPVRIIIPLTPGSGLDIVGRWVGQKLSVMWGQPVVVDNRPGAGSVVGTGMVAKAPADGYTVLVSGASHALNPVVYAKLPYDSIQDFSAIAPLAALYQVIVVAPTAGVKSVPELIAAARSKPGQLSYASPGVGTGVHFAGEKFRAVTGIDVVHVPYKGGPEAMNDVMTGRVTYWMPSIGTAIPFIKAGKLIALGVTSQNRSPALPDVPAVAQAGVSGFETSLWFGVWVPARTSPAIADKLATDVGRALATTDLREQLKTLVAEPLSMSRAQFTSFVREEIDTASRLAKDAGIKPQ